MTDRKKEYPWQKHYPDNINWDAEILPQPLFSILDDSAAKFPENICLDYYGQKTTYKEVKEQSDKMAKGLQASGVQKGTRIGLLMPNCPLFVIAYYAILKVGAIVVNYNPLYTINELTHQVNDSGTTMMITLDLNLLYEKTSNLLQTTPLEKVIVGNFKNSLPFPKNTLFSWFKPNEIADVPFGRINICAETLMDNNGSYQKIEIAPESDIAILQYTGGTTGTPKGAMLSHANLYANTFQAGLWFGELEEGTEKIIGVLPFFHVFAMTVVLNLGIYKACEIVLHSRLEMAAMLKDIEKKKITLLPGVPTLFNAINHHKKISSYDLTSLKFCISGGAALPAEVRAEFQEKSQSTLIEGYGLTECSPVAAANPLFGKNKDGSIGLPFPNTVIEIRSIEGRNPLVAKGEVGEICIKGPQVMLGYLNNEKETEQTINKGLLHTGDLGYMDSEGYVFVVDRLKEMIISNGFNIYPREIEEEIYKHNSVDEVAVIGVDSDSKGQDIKAFIKLRIGEELTSEKIKSFLKGKLTKYKIPSEVVFISEMPKTMIGKISKKDLK